MYPFSPQVTIQISIHHYKIIVLTLAFGLRPIAAPGPLVLALLALLWITQAWI